MPPWTDVPRWQVRSSLRAVALSKFEQPDRVSDQFQEGLAADIEEGWDNLIRLYDLRSTHATRLSAGGVADEWVTQLLRQTDAKVFKKYSQMKLQMKREALAKLNRQANEKECA
jgi:integrase